MVGFVLPFYLQDIRICPRRLWVFVYERTGFHGDVVPRCRLGCGQGRPRLPSTAGILSLVIAAFIGGFLRADSHWTSAVVVLALWGLATALFYPPNHAAMIGSVPRNIARRGYRGRICHVRSWEHIWDIDGYVITYRGVSLLQRRRVGNTDPGESWCSSAR